MFVINVVQQPMQEGDDGEPNVALVEYSRADM